MNIVESHQISSSMDAVRAFSCGYLQVKSHTSPQTFKDEMTIGLWHKTCVLNRIATQILSENITQRDEKGKREACQDAGVSIIVVCYVLPISLLLPGRNSA